MSNFNFNSRSTYLTFVSEWKATYKANSQIIRDLKNEIKELQKSGKSAGRQQISREYMRREQTRAIATRHESKIEAQRQWEEQNVRAAA